MSTTEVRFGSKIRGHTGFTLIELLIVVAIIALIAAILFPAFTRAREGARRSSCLSNMKQIGLAFHQYTQDYDERWPLVACQDIASSCGGTYFQGSRPWPMSIDAYLKGAQVMVCPDDNDKPDFARTAVTLPPLIDAGWPNVTLSTTGDQLAQIFPLSYSANQFLSDAFILSGGSASLAAQQHPAQCFLLTEYGTKTPGASLTGTNVGNFGIPLGAVPTTNWPNGGRHFGGRAFLFCDGHTKWVPDISGTVAASIQTAYQSAGVFSYPGT